MIFVQCSFNCHKDWIPIFVATCQPYIMNPINESRDTTDKEGANVVSVTLFNVPRASRGVAYVVEKE